MPWWPSSLRETWLMADRLCSRVGRSNFELLRPLKGWAYSYRALSRQCGEDFKTAAIYDITMLFGLPSPAVAVAHGKEPPTIIMTSAQHDSRRTSGEWQPSSELRCDVADITLVVRQD